MLLTDDMLLKTISEAKYRPLYEKAMNSRDEFISIYGPTVLQEKKGTDLLNYMFNSKNSLTYFLERDEEKLSLFGLAFPGSQNNIIVNYSVTYNRWQN